MALPLDLPDRLRAAGLTVVVLPGWHIRGRPATTGGFDPVGVLWHHTGGSSDSREYVEWMTYTGRPENGLPAPLCQLAISRGGIVYVCAAGRANHAGKAQASGTVAAGDGNELYVGVECLNTGSEGWGRAQYDAMVITGRVLGDLLGCTPNAQRGHRETSVTGKWDPGLLDLDRFRTDLAQEDTLSADAEKKIADIHKILTHVMEVRLDPEDGSQVKVFDRRDGRYQNYLLSRILTIVSGLAPADVDEQEVARLVVAAIDPVNLAAAIAEHMPAYELVKKENPS